MLFLPSDTKGLTIMRFGEAFELFESLTDRQKSLVLAWYVGNDHEKFAQLANEVRALTGPNLWGVS